jgi:hypothetical protein
LDHRHETKRDRKTVNEKQINHVADAIKGIKTKKKKQKNKTKHPKMEGRYRQHIIGTVVCQKCERTKSNSVSFFSHFYGEEKDKQTNPPQKKNYYSPLSGERLLSVRLTGSRRRSPE